MYEDILYDVQDPVATITLNRPEKLNALRDRTSRELMHALAEAEQDPRVVGIVLTGAGRGFCGGLDMQALATIQEAGEIASYRESDDVPTAEPGAPLAEDFRFGYGYIMSLRKPVVVAVNGACAGLGFSLAMFCDLRFASESAIFTTQFAQRGLVAEHGMGWLLSRLIGPSRALDVLWSGRRLSANEALELGLINRVVAPEDLLGEAQSYIEQLASTASPKALMQMKSQVYRYLNQTLGTAMADSGHLQDISVKWPDLQEGIASFVERRPPQFSRLSNAEPQWGRDE